MLQIQRLLQFRAGGFSIKNGSGHDFKHVRDTYILAHSSRIRSKCSNAATIVGTGFHFSNK